MGNSAGAVLRRVEQCSVASGAVLRGAVRQCDRAEDLQLGRQHDASMMPAWNRQLALARPAIALELAGYRCQTLFHVSMRGLLTLFDDAAFDTISDNLTLLPCVQSLDLRSTAIGDGGFSRFSEMLYRHCTLSSSEQKHAATSQRDSTERNGWIAEHCPIIRLPYDNGYVSSVVRVVSERVCVGCDECYTYSRV